MLAYALKRLARGLGSGRSGARQGFALALTTALTEIRGAVSLEGGLDLLKKSLEPITQSTKGAEARDILMGQLFGVATLVRAMASQSSGDGAPSDAERARFAARVAEEVSALAASKTYLAEAAASVILELNAALGPQRMSKVFAQAPALKKWLTLSPSQDASPENVLLGLEMWPSMPKDVRLLCAAVPGDGAHKSSTPQWDKVYARAHLKALCPALVEASYTHPQMHSIWDVLIKHLPDASEATGALEALWECVVECALGMRCGPTTRHTEVEATGRAVQHIRLHHTRAWPLLLPVLHAG